MSIPEGAYWIHNRQSSDRVLDSDNSGTANGTKVLAYPKNSAVVNRNSNQLWIVERLSDGKTHLIRNVHSGLVLDLTSTGVVCWRSHGGDNQKWRIEWCVDVGHKAYYRIRSVQNQKVLSHTPASSDAVSAQNVDNSDQKQQWLFSRYYHIPIYRFRVRSTGNVLDLSDGSAANGADVLAYPQNTGLLDARNQMWGVTNSGNNNYILHCLQTGTVADLARGGLADGTSICGWVYDATEGSQNQQWKFTETADVGGVVYYNISNVAGRTNIDAFEHDSRRRVGGWKKHEGHNQQWAMESIPTAGASWIFIQNVSTGEFLSVDEGTKTAIAGDGPKHSLDYAAHWRLLEKDRTGVYALVNRKLGHVLNYKSNSFPSLLVDSSTTDSQGTWWMLQAQDSGVKIVSMVNGRLLSETGISSVGTEDHSDDLGWKISEVRDSVVSFALVNKRTGLSLSWNGRLNMRDAIDDLHTQWEFNIMEHDSGRPLYVITNKATGAALESPMTLWKLVPLPGPSRCFTFEKYTQNAEKTKFITSHKYLGVGADGRAVVDSNEIRRDGSQHWELVSSRGTDGSTGYDLIFLDDDILDTLGPELAGEEGLELGHYVEKRSLTKQPKHGWTSHDVDDVTPIMESDPEHRTEKRSPGKSGKSGKSGKTGGWNLPRGNRVSPPPDENVRRLLDMLIDQWNLDSASAVTGPSSPVTIGRDEATRILGGALPRSIARIYNASTRPNTLFRIDRQGTPRMEGGRQYIDFQGQYGTDTYFHVIFPVGREYEYSADTIRGWLRASLERGTSVIITPTTTGPPQDDRATYRREPGTDTPRPDGSRNSWIQYTLLLLATIQTVSKSRQDL